MQVIDIVSSVVESAKIVLSSRNADFLEICAANKVIDMNVVDRAFLKRAIKIGSGLVGSKRSAGGKAQSRRLLGLLEMARSVAEILKGLGLTVTLSYRGGVVVTVGLGAQPKLLQLLTKTRAIALNNLPRLVAMVV